MVTMVQLQKTSTQLVQSLGITEQQLPVARALHRLGPRMSTPLWWCQLLRLFGKPFWKARFSVTIRVPIPVLF